MRGQLPNAQRATAKIESRLRRMKRYKRLRQNKLFSNKTRDDSDMPHAETGEADLKAALDLIVLESLPLVTIGSSAVYMIFAIGHVLFLPKRLAVPLTITACGLIVLLLSVRLILAKRSIPPRFVHPLATLLAVAIMSSILFHLYLSGELQQTTNLMLLIVAVGFFLLSGRWFVFFLALAIGGWAFIAVTIAPHPAAVHFAFGMLTATVLSIVAHVARVRTLRRVETLRLRDKRHSSQLERARDAALDSTRLKSQFIANVSHEIRTPMNGVMGMTELLLNTELSARQRNFAEAIQSSTDYLLAIINDILDFSKIEAGKLTFEIDDFDLRKVVDETFELLRETAAAKNLRLSATIDDDVPVRLRGDARRLRQVLINLLGNALKFTERGEVSLNVAAESIDASPATLRFTVRDTGIGISVETQQNLFQAFSQADSSTTRKYGGTGLGLAISKQIVELMGGRIGVESAPAQGSVFWFTAEFKQPFDSRLGTALALQSAPKARAASSPHNSNDLILIVEDNPVNQKLLAYQLEEMNYRFDIAADGLQALEALSHTRYALVLLDCQMPLMDGYTTASEIRRREKAHQQSSQRIPIIAMTAHAAPGERQKCIDAGMDDYISKPMKLELFATIIKRWMPDTARHAPNNSQESTRAAITDSLIEQQPSADGVLASDSAQPDQSDFPVEFHELFIEDTSLRLIALREAVQAKDAQLVRHMTHTLIGSCGFYGASDMARLCITLKEQASDGSLDQEASTTLAQIEKEYLTIKLSRRYAQETPGLQHPNL